MGGVLVLVPVGVVAAGGAGLVTVPIVCDGEGTTGTVPLLYTGGFGLGMALGVGVGLCRKTSCVSPG